MERMTTDQIAQAIRDGITAINAEIENLKEALAALDRACGKK